MAEFSLLCFLALIYPGFYLSGDFELGHYLLLKHYLYMDSRWLYIAYSC